MKKTIVVSVLLTTLTVLLSIVGFGAFAVRAAEPGMVLASAGGLWHGHGGGHGHGGHGRGMARACSHLDDTHVVDHAAELNRWVVEELTLDESQVAALTGATGALSDWAVDMRSVCEMPLGDAPQHVAAAVRIAQTADLALQRFAAAFDVFYATLSEEQRTKIDGWFAHRHGTES